MALKPTKQPGPCGLVFMQVSLTFFFVALRPFGCSIVSELGKTVEHLPIVMDMHVTESHLRVSQIVLQKCFVASVDNTDFVLGHGMRSLHGTESSPPPNLNNIPVFVSIPRANFMSLL